MAVFRWLCVLFAVAIAAGTSASAQSPHRNPAPHPAMGPPPTAQMQTQIAAVVNDQVISVYDLISRIRIVLLSSNLPDTPENRQHLQNQVMHQLIDEKLELQEAKKKGVSASDTEVETAIGLIEKQNNMKPGGLNEFLKTQSIDRGSLVDQITASIVWGKLVRRQAAETTEISDEEVDEAMRREKEHASEPEARVAEIFLAVDTPTQEAEVRTTADRLIDEMRKGARFSAIAQQFSQSATAAVGGDLGWIRPDQLSAELAKTVAGMRVGELSPPVRTGAGFYILLVLDRRTGSTGSSASDTVYDIVQVVLPLPNGASNAQRQAAAMAIEGIKNASKGCADFLRLGKEKGPQLTSEGHLRSSQISPQMRALVEKLQIGQTSQPILQKNGVGMLMLCAKQAGGGGGGAASVTRDSVMETIAKQRYDTVARRYLTDIRRQAYVDIRM